MRDADVLDDDDAELTATPNVALRGVRATLVPLAVAVAVTGCSMCRCLPSAQTDAGPGDAPVSVSDAGIRP